MFAPIGVECIKQSFRFSFERFIPLYRDVPERKKTNQAARQEQAQIGRKLVQQKFDHGSHPVSRRNNGCRADVRQGAHVVRESLPPPQNSSPVLMGRSITISSRFCLDNK